LLVVSAIAMIHPGAMTDIVGIGVLAAIMILQFVQNKKIENN